MSKQFCEKCGKRVPAGSPPCQQPWNVEPLGAYPATPVSWEEDGEQVRSMLPTQCLQRAPELTRAPE